MPDHQIHFLIATVVMIIGSLLGFRFIKFQKVDQKYAKKEAIQSFFAVLVITIILGLVIAIPTPEMIFGSRDVNNLVLTSSYTVLELLLLATYLIFKRKGFKDIGFTKNNLKESVYLGSIVSFALIFSSGFRNFTEGTFFLQSFSLTVMLTVGFTEEMLFRGFLQDRFIGWLGAKKGIVLASFVFALAHVPVRFFGRQMPTPELFLSLIPVFILGMIFGWMYQRSKNIAYPAIVHGVVNWV